jgi:transcriptional regulator with XRE-family HTH domain
MEIGETIRQARSHQGLSQSRLALRAGTDQAAVSRIERGEVSPSVETAERLLAALGLRLAAEPVPLERAYDPLHLRASLQRSPEERLRLAISWNRLAGRLAEEGKAADGH